ncbi:hypothetical protein L0657_06665 [Dyadobacter sp. CY345]|uniref:hypothetical protein n=1 Tax=Dyadobacter sp. CY345 TaxID=2909335 RepID=UPI001F456148|nr:hypothetical protein [Dyadobacter sp. CY345]MCF2443632.1 hypothetical protein [Dyadobacter sp. CY345]
MFKQIQIPVILSDKTKRLLADYNHIIHSDDDGKKKVIMPEIEELLKEVGTGAVMAGKKLLYDQAITFKESKIDYNAVDEDQYFNEVDEYNENASKAILLAGEIAELAGFVPKVDENDSLIEELQFALSKESIKATGTIERSVCGIRDGFGSTYEVCNYLRIKTEKGDEVVLFREDLVELLNIIQTVNRQTAGKFTI